MSSIYKNGVFYGRTDSDFDLLENRPQKDVTSLVDLITPMPIPTHYRGNFGCSPVGTVISVMGNLAPQNYLVCDGRVVNILDYPELANYFTAQFGSVNYFGGDGTSTFGIPNVTGAPTDMIFCIATKDIYVDARFDYSTTEKVVGKWIDGKPIYQKTYSGSTSTTDTVIDATMTDSIIDRVIDMRGISQSTNPSVNKKYWSSQYNVDNSDMFRISIHPVNGLMINLGSTYPQKPCTYQITLQYTKTTD